MQAWQGVVLGAGCPADHLRARPAGCPPVEAEKTYGPQTASAVMEPQCECCGSEAASGGCAPPTMARMVSELEPPQACAAQSVADAPRTADRPAAFRLLGGEGGTTGVGAAAVPPACGAAAVTVGE